MKTFHNGLRLLVILTYRTLSTGTQPNLRDRTCPGPSTVVPRPRSDGYDVIKNLRAIWRQHKTAQVV